MTPKSYGQDRRTHSNTARKFWSQVQTRLDANQDSPNATFKLKILKCIEIAKDVGGKSSRKLWFK